MSGWWTFDDIKHNNVCFIINSKELYFNDIRNFGTLIFCTKDKLEKKLSQFGPDILDINDNSKLFLERLKRKRKDTYIATALLDQKVASGCGNYLRAETLYLAKISPFKMIDEITEEELAKLWNIIRQVAWYFYNPSKGKKYKIITNEYSKMEKYDKIIKSMKKPDTHIFLVYSQTKDPNNNIVIRKQINKRTIHYVPKIQK